MSTIETPVEPSKPEKRTRVRGGAMENLVKASAKEVRAHCNEIAEALVKRVVAGDVNSARLLLALIDKLPKTKRKHLSASEQWMKSAVWQAPASPDDEDQKTDEPLSEELITALENFRRTEQEEWAARHTPSIPAPENPR